MFMRTLPYGLPLLELVHELSFTTAQLGAHPLGAAHIKDFETLLSATHKGLFRQLELTSAVAVAEAKVARADDVLNALLENVHLSLMQVVARDRDAPLYRRFFGAQRPSEAKRPILGAQLELMRGWVPVLQAAAQPELKALSAPLDAAVKAADAALSALGKAEGEQADFHEIGEVKALIDASNAARKITAGKLAEAVHKDPAANLPADFAEGFFLRDSRWTAPSVKELRTRVARTEALLARHKAQLAEAEGRERLATRAENEAQATALRQEVAEVESRLAADRARAAALREKLESLTPSLPVTPPPLPAPQ
jgi:hypothetical protein